MSTEIRVGQVWEHIGGDRVKATGLRLRITQVPGGRKRTYRFALVDPRPGGNGRVRRGDRKLVNPSVLDRRYRLVEAPDA